MKINKGVVIIGLISLLITYHGWFLSGYIVGGDFRIRSDSFFLDFFKNPSIWINSLDGGFPMTVNGYLNKFPIYYTGGYLTSIGLDYTIIQRLLFLFPVLFLGFVSSYFLSKKLFQNSNIAFSLAILFLLNTTLIELIFRSHIWFALVYAITPFLISSLISLLENKKNRFSVISSIILFFMFMIEPRMGLLHGLISLILALIITKGKYTFKDVCKYGIYTGLTFIILSSYWIFPLIMDILKFKTEVISSSIQNPNFIKSSASNFGNILNALSQVSKGMENGLYFGILFFLVTIYIYVISPKSTSKNILLLLFLLLVFLSKGIYAPFGNLNLEILGFNGITAAFKNTNKFALIGGLVFLLFLGYCLSNIKDKKSLNLLLVGLIVIGFGKNIFIIQGYYKDFGIGYEEGFSEFNGERNMFLPRNKNKVDPYYSYFNNLENNSYGYRTLWLPTLHDYRLTSNKTPYLSSGGFQINNKIISSYFNGPNGYITNKFINTESNIVNNYLCTFGINKILLKSEEEKEWGYLKGQNFSSYSNALNEKFTLSKVLENGAIVYSINCSEENNLKIKESSLLESAFKKQQNIRIINNKEISLNTGYHKGWGIFLGEKELDIENNLVNSYANSWNISKEEIISHVDKYYSRELENGDYPKTLSNGSLDYKYYIENPDGIIDVELTIYFKPQLYFYIGLIISGITFTLLILWLIIDSIYTRKRNKHV